MGITPGPWKVRGAEGDDWRNAAYGVVAENGDLVGFVTRRGTKEGLSNATAIAALPEMLGLLVELGIELCDFPTLDFCPQAKEALDEIINPILDKISALLRQIKGEETV